MTDLRQIFLEIDQREIEVQKLFVEHPNLSRFFYKREALPPKTTHPDDKDLRAQIYAICEILLRQFDFIMKYSAQAGGKPDAQWNPYLNRIKYVVSNSEVLRKFYDLHKDHYSEALATLFP